MSQHSIHAQIAEARAALHGEYVSANRVIDTLLDLRSLASDDQDMVDLIEHTLSTMPGRSVVLNTWWIESLEAIDRLGGDTARHLDPLPG